MNETKKKTHAGLHILGIVSLAALLLLGSCGRNDSDKVTATDKPHTSTTAPATKPETTPATTPGTSAPGTSVPGTSVPGTNPGTSAPSTNPGTTAPETTTSPVKRLR